MMTKFPAIARAKYHSEGKLTALRDRISSLVPPDEIVLTCGSYARREASTESDIDFFVITQQSDPADGEHFEPRTLPWFDDLKVAINGVVPTQPAEGGAFSNVEARDAMLHNIGGEQDNNAKMTRRMLFLLEGEWLFNNDGLKAIRRQILERYIGAGISDHQLALFLLNDVIRYYRTMAVDYEFKTGEGPTPKPWGNRLLPVRVSPSLFLSRRPRLIIAGEANCHPRTTASIVPSRLMTIIGTKSEQPLFSYIFDGRTRG